MKISYVTIYNDNGKTEVQFTRGMRKTGIYNPGEISLNRLEFTLKYGYRKPVDTRIHLFTDEILVVNQMSRS